MTKSPSNDSKDNKTAHESEAQAAERAAGKTDKSSGDHMSRTKAGDDKGAGGGAKQEQKH